MRSIAQTWRIFARRSAANWRLLSVLALGVVMAGTLLASAPVYARTMADLGLTFLVRDQLNANPGNRAEFRYIQIQSEEGKALRAAVEQRIDERIGWFRGSQSRYILSGRFVLTRDGEAAGPRLPLGQLQSLTGYKEFVSVVEGRFPATTAPGAAVEVAIGRSAAQAGNLAVGQSFDLAEDSDTCERFIPIDDAPPLPPCTPGAVVRFKFPATVVGIIEPNDTDDPFWILGSRQFFQPVRNIPEAGPTLPMFTTEETMLDSFGALHPAYRVDLAWHTFANPELLSRTNFERARSDLRALYAEFSPIGGASYSPLTNTLEDYSRSSRYQQAPLTILLLEVSAVALFYVVLVASVIVERQADEIALLRSRGATIVQVGAIYLLEGLLIGIPALLVAPFLAGAATAALGLTPIFEDVSQGELLPVQIPLSSFGMAAIGVGLSLVALVAPAIVVARRSAVARRRDQARPGVSILQRYYLDFALAGVAAVLLWELRERGSVFEPSPTGGVSSDPLLLASPAILMAAAAALLLRFYPLILRVAAAVLTRRTGPTLTIGLWQVVRSPGNYTRLALLLMLAVAVGTFAASYSSTADRTYKERQLYASGVEYRNSSLNSSSLGTDSETTERELAALPGVQKVSTVVRTAGAPGTAGQSATQVQVLGVNPDAAATMLWFREDFADKPLQDLLAGLGDPAPLRGKVLPNDVSELSIWVNTSESSPSLTLWARVSDRDQTYNMIEFGNLEGSGWRELRAQVRPRYDGTLGEPLTLVSFVITEPSNRFNTSNLTISFDNIAALNAGGTRTALETFEGTAPGWELLPPRGNAKETLELVRQDAQEGTGALKVTRPVGTSSDLWGFYVQQSNIPLPIIASESFSGATGIGVGGVGLMQVEGLLVPVRVVENFRLFPTLETAEGPSVVFNREHLLAWFGIAEAGVSTSLNEAWFELAPDADKVALAEAFRDPNFGLGGAVDRDELLRTVDANPLIAAGGSGILFLAFLAVLILVGAALLLSLGMAVRQRRMEFAVLRALGLSRGQIFRLLVFEYSIVAVVGLVAGAYLGLLVGQRMLSFLNVNEAGDRAEPSFILETEWLVVLTGAAIVLGVFALALVLASRLLGRTSDAQALRLE